jgi:uncharacterized protein YdeI (YjbR/CyaY-like superfamily)
MNAHLFETVDDWEAWLETHVADYDGIWIRFAKKRAPSSSINYQQALDSALCFGWIDGQSKSESEFYYIQRFTPRRTKSIWSHRNTLKAETLIAEGRMRPSGLAEIERAKADGRWDAAYRGQSSIEVPPDLAAALAQNAAAGAFFASLSKTQRYPFLFRLHHLKSKGNRAKRIKEYIALLAEGKCLR